MSKEKPTEAMIAKLPRWAQDHIVDLQRQRSEAVKALNEYTDNQTPSKVYWEDYLSTGEAKAGPSSKRNYVQTYRLFFESCGVRLEVSCHEGDSMHYPGIDLKWEDMFGHSQQIAFVPTSFQSASLIAKHNMKVTKVHPKQCLTRFGAHKFKNGVCLNCGTPKDNSNLDDLALIRRFKQDMLALAKRNDDDFRVDITFDEQGYHVQVIETADKHTFVAGRGPDLDTAIGAVYANLGAAAKEWGYET